MLGYFFEEYNSLLLWLNNYNGVATYYAYKIWEPILVPHWNALSNLLAVEGSSNTSTFYQPNVWLDLFFNNVGYIWCIIAISMFSVLISRRLLVNVLGGRDSYLANYVYLEDLEEEVGSIDDAAYYIICFGLLISWFYYFTITARFIIIKHQLFLVTIFMIILVSGLVIPGALLAQMGLQFTQFVRGSGRSAGIIFEVILDAVAVSVIMIRFFVQNIRFVFIFLAFFELYEFVLDLVLYDPMRVALDINLSDAVQHIKEHGPTIYIFVKLIVSWFYYLYYLGHLTILFMIQLGIYFVLSFWLYFFLYTAFVMEAGEKYFFYKRSLN